MARPKFPDFVPPTKIHYVGGRPKELRLRKCKLVYEGKNGQEERVFDKPVISIGSMAENDIVLQDDTVSRFHCKIYQGEDSYILTDLDSTNGTSINGVRIREAYLQPGCSVTAGQSELKFYALDERVQVVPSTRDRCGDIIGRSMQMRELFGIIEKIAPTGATVVIEGETGTGKEVVARSIHQLSQRAKGPFTVFDCGAVPANLIESELFGHEKGSFTGAVMTRQGLFEVAQRGTIFLDELGELELDLQPKLLRVLEQREVRRVGSTKPIKVDVRVIAATNRNLEKEVREGRFREDLFYRLSVVRLILPPLRDRVEDIPLLCDHLLAKLSFNRDREGNQRVNSVDKAVMDAMMTYRWPGNVRELINVIERACSFADSSSVTLADMPEHISGMHRSSSRSSFPAAVGLGRSSGSSDDETGPATAVPSALQDMPFKEAKEEWVSSFERDYILSLLRKNSMNISHAAREADIDRKYFRKLMKKYEISVSAGGDSTGSH